MAIDRRSLSFLAIAGVCLLRSLPMYAQGDSAAVLFDGASVKNVANADGVRVLWFDPERFEALNTLRYIIATAYAIQNVRIEEGPKWLDTDFFQIVAKVPRGADADSVREMLRGLLAERFALKAHRQEKIIPVLALVTAKRDGADKARLRPTVVNCAEIKLDRPMPALSSKEWCGIRGNGPRRIVSQGTTMAEFARRTLTASLDQIVIDETGLAGGYDFDFDWFPPRTASDAGPEIGTALAEQLGLKLIRVRRPVEFLSIDHVERPTPD